MFKVYGSKLSVEKYTKVVGLRDLLKTLSRKGAREVLEQLSKSQKRFSQLANVIKSRRTLAKRLRELEEVGLIKREVTEDRPPTTIYRLTPRGKEALDAIAKFGEIG